MKSQVQNARLLEEAILNAMKAISLVLRSALNRIFSGVSIERATAKLLSDGIALVSEFTLKADPPVEEFKY